MQIMFFTSRLKISIFSTKNNIVSYREISIICSNTQKLTLKNFKKNLNQNPK